MKDEKKLVEDEQQATAERVYKSTLSAPCAYPGPDPRTGKMRNYYPTVNCQADCSHCGWNPVVKKKRVAKMLAELDARRREEAKAKRRKKGAKK